jgi:error-prone DNA polymerase
MPDDPSPKPHAHPIHAAGNAFPASPAIASRDGHVHLDVTSSFTFLTGASHPEELVERAADHGAPAVAIADRHSLAGAVRAHVAARERGIRAIVGTRLTLPPADPPADVPATDEAVRAARFGEILLFPTDLASYARLCRLLTLGKRRAPKGGCDLSVHDILDHREGLVAIVRPPRTLDGDAVALLERLRGDFDADRLSLAIERTGRPGDAERSRQLVSLAEWTGVPLVATNAVVTHDPARTPLGDILTCIRRGTTLAGAGRALAPNRERHLKPPGEMASLFADLPEAVHRSAEIARRTEGFSLDALRYRYPSELVPKGLDAMAWLRELVRRGARERYPRGVPAAVERQVDHELAIIADLGYAHYFLTVHDLVAFARSRGILCQGRGAAANSAACYCLGITSVDPARIDVLFERFVSRERNEPPDIDIDFEHERREEVIQYLYRKYGRDRAALCAEVISYRGRSAIRDVGKALGLSLDLVGKLSAAVDGGYGEEGEARLLDPVRLGELGLDPAAPELRRLGWLAGELLGFPRHLSQHVGGFVLTDGPLCELVPIENAAMDGRTVIEWDKDDIDAMGMLKVDVLALGMLTCLRKTIDLVNLDAAGRGGPAVSGSRPVARDAAAFAAPPPRGPDEPVPVPPPPELALHVIPAEDPAVYDMLCRADTVGVFQVESRAQMSMLPRLRPRRFYDLVIEVAIVRPGPIQGDMVHPYLRRRDGLEPATYPDEAIRAVLGRTLGVPLFQEQAMALAVAAAGFTPGEADSLRRAIAAWKRKGNRIAEYGRKLEEGMVARGYTREFARQVFTQVQGFSGYGFPESHAASFALLVYASAWLKCRHPAAFAAGLLNSQPMGFYAPAQILRDAREHGIEIRPVDVNASGRDGSLERGPDRFARRANGGSEVDGARPASSGPSSSGFRDRRAHGPLDRRRIEAHSLPRPPSVAADQPAIRLGFRLVRGLADADADRIVAAVRGGGPFATVEALRRASGVSIGGLRRLAAADAFGSMGLSRQQALWQIRRLREESLPLFDGLGDSPAAAEPPSKSPLPPVGELTVIARDHAATGVSLRRHPLACLRARIARLGGVPCGTLRDELLAPTGLRLAVAGTVLLRQRPSTANGVVFMTLEDESGIANLIFRPKVYERCRRDARRATMLLARGRVERRGEVVHLLVSSVLDLGPMLAEAGEVDAGELTPASRDFR